MYIFETIETIGQVFLIVFRRLPHIEFNALRENFAKSEKSFHYFLYVF